MYRMQVFDGRTAGMHWQRQKIGAEHYREMLRTTAQSTAHVGTGAIAHPARADFVRASVDIMARTSGGSQIPDGDLPSGQMEVAIAIGTDPAITFSAIVPAPPDIEEYLIAG